MSNNTSITDKVHIGISARKEDSSRLVSHFVDLLKSLGFPKPEKYHYGEGEITTINGWDEFRNLNLWNGLKDTIEVNTPVYSILIIPVNNDVKIGLHFEEANFARQSIRDILHIFHVLPSQVELVSARAEHNGLSTAFFRKHYRHNKRTPNAPGLYWLQYWGKREFLRQGGEAIFDNPYIQAEKIGEGVLIQVGEDPWQAHTPEGEALLVKATQALPPVIVDWGPGKKPLA